MLSLRKTGEKKNRQSKEKTTPQKKKVNSG